MTLLHLLRRNPIFLEWGWRPDKEIPGSIVHRGAEVLVTAALDLATDNFAYRFRQGDIVSSHDSSLCHGRHFRKRTRKPPGIPHGGLHCDWGCSPAEKNGTTAVPELLERPAPVLPVHTSCANVL